LVSRANRHGGTALSGACRLSTGEVLVMQQVSTTTLEARRNALLKKLAEAGPFVQGSLCKVKIKCGKPRCKCAKGEHHEAYVLSKTVRGKTVTTHIPRDLLDEVKSWAEEQKRIKKLTREISDLSEQIIRIHVKERRSQSAKEDNGGRRGNSGGGVKENAG
jgi:hypothetical protein